MPDGEKRERGQRGPAGVCAECGFDHGWDEGPDHCLGWIPGVVHACCGHGCQGDEPYAILGGVMAGPDPYRHMTIKGDDAVTFFELAKRAHLVEPHDMVKPFFPED